MMFASGFVVALLAGSAASSAIPRSEQPNAFNNKRDDGTCTGGPWVDPTFVGGYQQGVSTDFCETGYPTYAVPINTITIWSTTEAVRGLQFGFDGGPLSQTYGATSGEGITSQTITVNYAAGELFTTAALFAQDGAMYLRGLTLETNMGQTVHGGVTQNNGEGIPYQLQDVGTGLLIGAAGDYQAGIIDNLGLLFLNSPIADITVTDLSFPNGPAGTQGVTPMTLDSQHYYNGDPNNSQMFNWMGSKQVTSSSTFTQVTTSTFQSTSAVTISGQTPILDIVKASGTQTFQWTMTSTSMSATTTTTANTLTWSQSGTLSPGEGITCNAVSGHGSGSFPYTSTVTVTLQDGQVWAQYEEGGTLNIDDVSSNSVACVPDNTPS